MKRGNRLSDTWVFVCMATLQLERSQNIRKRSKLFLLRYIFTIPLHILHVKLKQTMQKEHLSFDLIPFYAAWFKTVLTLINNLKRLFDDSNMRTFHTASVWLLSLTLTSLPLLLRMVYRWKLIFDITWHNTFVHVSCSPCSFVPSFK